jgi:DNA polymerase III epsilon subunit-like protein
MAMINTVGGEKSGNDHNILINWGSDFKFSKGAEAMAHSYSEERMNKEGVKPIEALKILSENLNNCDGIVGHNILGFDIYLIKCIYNKLGRPYPDILSKKPVFDTFAMAKGYFNNIPYQKGDDFVFYQYKVLNQIIKGSKNSLSKVASNFNIEYDESRLHDGLYDLELNVQIWNKLKYQVDI